MIYQPNWCYAVTRDADKVEHAAEAPQAELQRQSTQGSRGADQQELSLRVLSNAWKRRRRAAFQSQHRRKHTPRTTARIKAD
jgi:hypothetical protein